MKISIIFTYKSRSYCITIFLVYQDYNSKEKTLVCACYVSTLKNTLNRFQAQKSIIQTWFKELLDVSLIVTFSIQDGAPYLQLLLNKGFKITYISESNQIVKSLFKKRYGLFVLVSTPQTEKSETLSCQTSWDVPPNTASCVWCRCS